MDVNKRIEELKPYFKGFNMDGACAGISVQFPPKWKVTCNQILLEKYNTGVQVGQNNFYLFAVDMQHEDNLENLFNAVTFVINYQEEMAKKNELIKAKVDELKALFLNEPLEKLQTLQFTFDEKKTSKKKNNKKTDNAKPVSDTSTSENVEDEIEDNNITMDSIDNLVENDVEPTTINIPKPNDSANMSFVKKLINKQ